MGERTGSWQFLHHSLLYLPLPGRPGVGGLSGLRRDGGRNGPHFVLTPKVSSIPILTALALQALL